MAEPTDFTQYKTDHDLLIELRTEFRGMRDDIIEIKTGTVARVTSLEGDRVTRKKMDGIEADIESLKLWRSALIGAWGVCTLILIPLAFAVFT